MNEMSRRSLLKGLAAAPVVSALSPLDHVLAQSRTPTTELCLWFHGLFAFVIMNDYIAVVTPKVGEHVYLAGLWKQEQPMRAGEWYRLSGVSDAAHPNRLPATGMDKMLLLTGVNAFNIAESFCLIRLPFPTQMIPMRYARASFSGRDAVKTSSISTFPTVQVMRYNVVDYSNLRLEPFKGWVTQKKPPSIINFHIFAEPPAMVIPDHAMRAFEGMIRLFPSIDLKLSDTSEACFPLDTNLPAGLDPQQQISIAERNGACKKQPSIRTGNCFMIMVDARTT